MKNKRLFIVAAVVVGLLLVPLVAMQFTNQVNWSLTDFIAMGMLLLSAGLLIELTLRKFTDIKHRTIACIAVLVVFLLVWAELAVGIFGTLLAGS